MKRIEKNRSLRIVVHTSPWSPFCPVSPCGPWGPIGPWNGRKTSCIYTFPIKHINITWRPWMPCCPCGPISPCGPCEPIGNSSSEQIDSEDAMYYLPVSPIGPTAPVKPMIPYRNRKSDNRRMIISVLFHPARLYLLWHLSDLVFPKTTSFKGWHRLDLTDLSTG